MEQPLDIPLAWESLHPEQFADTLMVIGGVDTGKSTFARYLYGSLRLAGRCVAFLDGDPGQSAFGPPTTMTLVYDVDLDPGFTWNNNARRYFIGSTTPQGHMLSTLVGSARLIQVAREAGAEVVIYDTTGLIAPRLGGVALKSAKIALLQPAMIFAIQWEHELEPLLTSLRRSNRTKLIDLNPSLAVLPRDPSTRREHRIRQFANCFCGAQPLVVNWTKIPVFPFPLFRIHRLMALEDVSGFTLGLGIVRHIDRTSREVEFLSTKSSLENVNALRLGDVLLNPDTFQDERIV